MIRPTSPARPLVLAAALATSCAFAQQPPDAGQTLQLLQQLQRQAPQPRPEGPALDILRSGSVALPASTDRVTLRSVRLSGPTVIDTDTLLAELGPVAGQSFDLAGLRALAQRVTDLYTRQGYPFARAFLPAQSLADGVLTIQVLEGRYGTVRAVAEDDALAGAAQGYLARLQPGEVIEGSALERATLVLNDLPGVQTLPVMRPGRALGTGDLEVRLATTRSMVGEVGLDNYGSRYSGEVRARVAMAWNNPFMLGDQLTASALHTDAQLWLGSLGYARPIGSDGLRASASWSRTAYALREGFEGNEGTAEASSLSASYPLVRSQRSNLLVSVAWQEKALFNSRVFGASTERYRIRSLPVSLSFDHRDSLGGAGVSSGLVSFTPGSLEKADPVRQGHFSKFNLDLVRLQALPGSLELSTRLVGQRASRNLDSAESFSLGGPGAVRAYPTGEAIGDEGALAQAEVRASFGMWSPFAFYDHGRVKVNARPGALGTAARYEERAGAGAGLRVQDGAWSMEGLLAWRTHGGAPQAVQGRDPRPRAWFNARYAF